jgi:hypothetical protein
MGATEFRVYESVAIASGAALSAEIDLFGQVPVAIMTPAAMTGTNFNFQAGIVSGTVLPVYDATAVYTVGLATNSFVPLDPNKFWGARFLKIGVNTNEAAARTVTLITRPL